MIHFVIAGDVTDRSHLRITYFDEICASGSCEGTDVYLQSGIQGGQEGATSVSAGARTNH